MDLEEVIQNRRSIRSFQEKEIEQEKIDEILKAAIMAPSAGNQQPWEFIVIKDKEQKRKVAQAAHNEDMINSAPLVIVVCANKDRTSSRYGDRGSTLYCIQDCAAATQNLLLTAHSLGLGTCWVGSFDEGKLAEVLNLPEHVRPLVIIPIGYPAEKPEAPKRLELEKIVHSERFSEK